MEYLDNLIPGHNFLLFLPPSHKILSLLKHFHSPRVQRWIKQLSSIHPYIHHCLLCVLQEAILPFVVLALNAELLHHAELNAALPPKGFQLVNSAFPNLILLVEQAAYGNHLNPLTSAPNSFLWPSPPRAMTAAPSASAATSKALIGLFVLKGGAKRPCLDDPLGPNKARMCLNHCFVGSFCPHSDAHCKFFHATTWAQLSAATKKLVTAYVNAHPAADFSPFSGAHPMQDLFYMLPLCSSLAQSGPRATINTRHTLLPSHDGSCPTPPTVRLPCVLSSKPVTLLTFKHVPTNPASILYTSTQHVQESD
eukprot:jgi/Psemu1/33189/gm1.33189_g